jgi:hypothetical protein
MKDRCKVTLPTPGERTTYSNGRHCSYSGIRAAGSNCKERVFSSSLPERSCPRAGAEPSSATHGADERGRGEAGTNYRDQAVRKGSRGPTMSHMFLSSSLVSPSTAQINPLRPSPRHSATDSLSDLP